MKVLILNGSARVKGCTARGGKSGICNFLQSFSIKVSDERLNNIPKEKRREMVKEMRKNLDVLEEITEAYWSEAAECHGWKQILDFITDKAE